MPFEVIVVVPLQQVDHFMHQYIFKALQGLLGQAQVQPDSS